MLATLRGGIDVSERARYSASAITAVCRTSGGEATGDVAAVTSGPIRAGVMGRRPGVPRCVRRSMHPASGCLASALLVTFAARAGGACLSEIVCIYIAPD